MNNPTRKWKAFSKAASLPGEMAQAPEQFLPAFFVSA